MAKEHPGKILDDLSELAHFLDDGPEQQREMNLPQAELFDGKQAPNPDDLPILTSFIDQPDEASADARLNTLVDELVEELLPRLEQELKRRLKARLSDKQV